MQEEHLSSKIWKKGIVQFERCEIFSKKSGNTVDIILDVEPKWWEKEKSVKLRLKNLIIVKSFRI